MHDALDILFCHTWWSWTRDRALPYSPAYHWFNLFEGAAWTVCAAIVFGRHLRYRHSLLEVWYALAFLAFGITDFIEAQQQASWLLWIKGVNLAVLVWLRRTVIRRFYPTRKLL